MTYITKHIKLDRFFVFLTTVFSMTYIASASAQNIDAVPSPLAIAEQIETQSLVLLPSNQLPADSLSQIINEIFEVQTGGDQKQFISTVEKLSEFKNDSNSNRISSLSKLFLGYSQMKDFENLIEENSQITSYLLEFTNHPEWLVGFQANRLLAMEQSQSQRNSNAIKTMQNALNIIPNDLTDEAINARIAAIEMIAYLQNLKLNKDLALINTQKLIDLKLEAGQPIDGIELLNNLMYSLARWGENDVRLELAQTLKRLETKFGSMTPGLTDIHISKIYVDIGDYDKAKKAATTALNTTNLSSLKHSAQLTLATAYAGLGEIAQARTLYSGVPESFRNTNSGKYAQALIALNSGQTDTALTLLNERQMSINRRFLEKNAENTIEILASLENTSERQAEREAALQREAELVRSQLAQQQNINKLLIALITLIGLTGIASLLFARHRHKLAKMLEVKTREAESADRLKTEFLGLVSHELRTPLNGIIGIADILVQQGPTETVRKRGDIILGSGQQLFSMIDSIIDMSRLESQKLDLSFEKNSVKDILNRQIEKWSKDTREKGIIFTHHIASDLADEVEIDSHNLEKCFETLISNAVKFTQKGRVHLHLTSEDLSNSSKTQFTFIVADTGMGMSKDVQSKLFTPFLQADSSMTRKFGGAGLRLAISRSLARMMGGDIVVNSREGRGSEFTLTFQAERPEISSVETENPQATHASPALLDLSVFKSQKTSKPVTTNKESLAPETEETAKTIISNPASAVTKNNEIKQTPKRTEAKNKVEGENLNIINIAVGPDQNWSENASVFENIKDIASKQKTEPASSDPYASSFTLNIKDTRVLLIEDTLSNQEVIYALLQNEDMKCTVANSAQDGLKMLEHQHFDMIIMDVRLPGMDGIEATRIIRKSGQAWANIPIIALTADATAENNAACMEAGMDVFLTKPILLNELQSAIGFLNKVKPSEANKSDSQSVSSATIAS